MPLDPRISGNTTAVAANGRPGLRTGFERYVERRGGYGLIILFSNRRPGPSLFRLRRTSTSEAAKSGWQASDKDGVVIDNNVWLGGGPYRND